MTASAPLPPEQHLPERMLPARRLVVDDAMPADWQRRMGLQLYELRHHLVRSGDSDGDDDEIEFYWELDAVERLAPELTRQLRARVLDGVEAAAKACGVAPFVPSRVTMCALLLHHGGHVSWASSPDQKPALDWELTLHSEPRMFRGGAGEWLDGTVVEPATGRLVYRDRHQAHATTRVECWSAHVLHGRWSIVGSID